MTDKPKAISLSGGQGLSAEDQELAALATEALRSRVTDIIAQLGVPAAADALLTLTAQVLVTAAGEANAARIMRRGADAVPRMAAAMRNTKDAA